MLRQANFREVHKMIQDLYDLIDEKEQLTSGLKPVLERSLVAISDALTAASLAPVKKVTSTIPFGYQEGIKEGTLDPVPLEMEALKRAQEYLESSSSRDVAAWVTETTGRYISHSGLLERMKKGIYLIK